MSADSERRNWSAFCDLTATMKFVLVQQSCRNAWRRVQLSVWLAKQALTAQTYRETLSGGRREVSSQTQADVIGN
jgi:hypothetical protein